MADGTWEVEVTTAFAAWWDSLTGDQQGVAILLLGGEKTGDDRWYVRAVPEADRLYDEHLNLLREEGLL